LARGGKIFAHQALGKLTFYDDSPDVRIDSLKRIASITKLFTATAIMQLVEDGKLWLEQAVKEIIPEFDNPIHGKINLWHLLTHTSGLPADPGYFLEPYPLSWERLEKEAWLREVLAGPVQHEPGAQWNYCTVGYLVLGEVVSRMAGCRYNDYVERRIFKPLGMDRTFMQVPDALHGEVCLRDEIAAGHLGALKTRPSAFPAQSGGGAYSTLYDLWRFGQCFLNNGTLDGARILGRKTVETMMRDQLDHVPSFHWGKNCKAFRYGLGWSFFCDGPTVSTECVNHEGWGWYSLFVDPREQFISVSYFDDNRDWDPKVMVNTRTIAFSGIV
jgi:CubicO group peptidase (beta-lactamase class C family)